MDLTSEIENPYHLEKPPFHTTEASIQLGDCEIVFYLDINSKDKIVAAYFTLDKSNRWLPHFSAFCRWLEDKNISQVQIQDFIDEIDYLEYSEEDFLFPPHALYFQAIEKYKGQTFHHELLQQDASSLVCRCFGIYEEQIVNLVKQNPNIDLKGVTDENMAGGGCTSCSNDIVGIITTARDFYGLNLENKNQKIKGLYPAEMVLLLDSLLKEYSKDIEVISLLGYELKIASKEKVNFEEIQNYLMKETEVGFKVFS